MACIFSSVELSQRSLQHKQNQISTEIVFLWEIGRFIKALAVPTLALYALYLFDPFMFGCFGFKPAAGLRVEVAVGSENSIAGWK